MNKNLKWLNVFFDKHVYLLLKKKYFYNEYFYNVFKMSKAWSRSVVPKNFKSAHSKSLLILPKTTSIILWLYCINNI